MRPDECKGRLTVIPDRRASWFTTRPEDRGGITEPAAVPAMLAYITYIFLPKLSTRGRGACCGPLYKGIRICGGWRYTVE